jgi:protein gp37
MSDLFHEKVPEAFIDEIFGVMAVAHKLYGHTFQVLTKRHGRMRSYLNAVSTRKAIAHAAHRWAIDRVNAGALSDAIEFGNNWPLPNVWLGVSVEDQQWANIRVPALLDSPAAVRWISAEPLLGPVDLSQWLGPVDWPSCWERHSPTTECSQCIQPEWVITGGESGPGFRPADLDWFRQIRDQCVQAGVAYLHKQNGGIRPKANGRLLDGRTWDEYPAEVGRG